MPCPSGTPACLSAHTTVYARARGALLPFDAGCAHWRACVHARRRRRAVAAALAAGDDHTYIHTYIHIYMRTYIRTYLHTHTYIYICAASATGAIGCRSSARWSSTARCEPSCASLPRPPAACSARLSCALARACSIRARPVHERACVRGVRACVRAFLACVRLSVRARLRPSGRLRPHARPSSVRRVLSARQLMKVIVSTPIDWCVRTAPPTAGARAPPPPLSAFGLLPLPAHPSRAATGGY